jgi:L-threonylcarbamoyladenylate synthase
MKARLYRPTPLNLRRLAAALRNGDLVAIPTETVYGLAANALDPKACRAIFRAKRRPANDPLIVHVLDLAHAEQLAHFNDAARRLARRFWPGPLTLVLPKKDCVPGIVTSEGPTVALRAPAHPLARRLLQLAAIPLAAPSANPFSYISPTTADHVRDGLGNQIPHIVDGGSCAVGVESTVLDLTRPDLPRILRPGVIGATELQQALGRRVTVVHRGKARGRLVSPGQLARHYSPRTPVKITSAPRQTDGQTGLILLRRPPGTAASNTYWLSERGSLSEIARNLYRVLRQADAAKHHRILIECVPSAAGGLAAAINDRIGRAAARRGA